MKKKKGLLLTLTVIAVLVFSSTVLAFGDVKDESANEKISALHEADIINGISENEFGPNENLTYAQGIQMIVKGMGLNIDNLRFIKAPKASDYYENVEDDAWYADTFIIAYHNGLDLPKDVNPQKKMTREEYTYYLGKALTQTGNYPMIDIYMIMKDENQVNSDYMGTLQMMLIFDITELDKEQYFHPKQKIARKEAAVMLYNAVQFVKKQKSDQQNDEPTTDNPDEPVSSPPIPIEDPPLPKDPVIQDDVKMTTKKINDEIIKVIVSWGEQPNPGYQMTIKKIVFNEETKKAAVYYQLHYPDPDKMYPQVIVNPKANTYVSTDYEPVTARYYGTSGVECTDEGCSSPGFKGIGTQPNIYPPANPAEAPDLKQAQ